MNEQKIKSNHSDDSKSAVIVSRINIEELKVVDSETLRRLFAINNEGFEQKGYRKPSLYGMVNDNRSKVLLAKDSNDNILGFLIYRMENPQHAHISCLVVDPRSQRHGIGSALMSKVIDVADENTAFSLDCRPRNEPYYRQFGFKTIGQIRAGYYKDFGFASPGLYMLLDNKKNRQIKKRKGERITENCTDFQTFITLAQLLRDHSSWWFSRSFRSRRKENSFDAIAIELSVCHKDGNKSIDSLHLLLAIVHNALIVRGSSAAHTETTTGRYLLNLLNKNPDFATVKNLILCKLGDYSEQLEYKNLKRFSLINPGNEKSEYFSNNISPYYHFYKLSAEPAVKRPHANGYFKTLAKIGFFIGNNYLLGASIHGILHNDTESLAFIHQTVANICLAKIGDINAGIAAGVGIDVVYLVAIAWYAKQYYKTKEVENYCSFSVVEKNNAMF